MWIG
jgi:manganese transport protein